MIVPDVSRLSLSCRGLASSNPPLQVSPARDQSDNPGFHVTPKLSLGYWKNSASCGCRSENLDVPRATHCPLLCGPIMATAFPGPTVDDPAKRSPKRVCLVSLDIKLTSFHLCLYLSHTLTEHRPGKDLQGHPWVILPWKISVKG